MRYLAGLVFVATAAASCTLVLFVSGVGFGSGEAKTTTGSSAITKAAQARRTATRFLRALDRDDYAAACGLFSRSFYRDHRVPDRAHCVATLRLTMSGTDVSFRILRVRVRGATAKVRTRVNGASRTITVRKQRAGYRVTALTGTGG